MKTKLLGLLLATVIFFSGLSSFAQAAVSQKQSKLLLNKKITRSEFAVMLHDSLDIEMEYYLKPDIKDYFDDIRQDAPYASAVIDLVTANILEGKGSFRPEAVLTREEMIHCIMQAYKYKMGDRYAMIKIGPATFKDAGKITAQYSGDVARAQHYKLVRGYGNQLFQPKKAATKAAAQAVINKLIKLLKQQNLQVTVSPEAVATETSIDMKLIVQNNTDNDIYIENTSGQKFDFELLDGNKNLLYRWSADKAFTDSLTSTVIKAGKTLISSSTLSGDAYQTIKDKAVYLKAYITGNAGFINSEGYIIQIK